MDFESERKTSEHCQHDAESFDFHCEACLRAELCSLTRLAQYLEQDGYLEVDRSKGDVDSPSASSLLLQAISVILVRNDREVVAVCSTGQIHLV